MDYQEIFSQSTKKPQSILKIVISISVVMLLMWLFVVSRMDMGNVTDASEPETIERTEGLKTSLIKPVETGSEKRVEKKEAPAMFQNAFITFLVMICVLGGVWFWAKRKGKTPRTKENSRELGAHVLGQGVQLKFIEVNEEVWVMGLTSGSVNLLHRVPKDEWKDGEVDIDSPEFGHKSIKTNTGDFKSLYKFFTN